MIARKNMRHVLAFAVVSLVVVTATGIVGRNFRAQTGGGTCSQNCGTFTLASVHNMNMPMSVSTGDLNGDGKEDMVSCARDGNALPEDRGACMVFFNKGNGTFNLAPDAKYKYALGILTTAIGDLNGDGKNDLAIAVSKDMQDSEPNLNKILVALNTGNGSFATPVAYATQVYPRDVAIGDLNGDGKNDLAVGTTSVNAVSVLLNKGDGTFHARTEYVTSGGALGVAIGDLNGDGKPDLAVGTVPSANAGGVSVFINKGDGTFNLKADYAAGKTSASVAIADFSGDGKPDLAVANNGADTVSILVNNGNGTFASKVDYPTASRPNKVLAADLDKDGKPDLAVAMYGTVVLSTLRNNGDGTFATKVDYTQQLPMNVQNSTDIAAINLKGNGKVDLAISNHYGVAVFLNNCTGCAASSAAQSNAPATLPAASSSSAATICPACATACAGQQLQTPWSAPSPTCTNNIVSCADGSVPYCKFNYAYYTGIFGELTCQPTGSPRCSFFGGTGTPACIGAVPECGPSPCSNGGEVICPPSYTKQELTNSALNRCFVTCVANGQPSVMAYCSGPPVGVATCSQCLAQNCASTTNNVCGDNICASGENCPADCAPAPSSSSTGGGETVPVCGNGICESGETPCQCPVGPTCQCAASENQCPIDCSNATSSAAASIAPVNATCGNAVREGSETCDDGNTTAGDGCSATCQAEPGYACAPGQEQEFPAPSCSGTAPACAEGGSLLCPPEYPVSSCQNGVALCTDPQNPGAASLAVCNGGSDVCTRRPGGCGDFVIEESEACDDGNLANGDGCSAACVVEDGWTCDAGGSCPACGEVCGGGQAYVAPPPGKKSLFAWIWGMLFGAEPSTLVAQVSASPPVCVTLTTGQRRVVCPSGGTPKCYVAGANPQCSGLGTNTAVTCYNQFMTASAAYCEVAGSGPVSSAPSSTTATCVNRVPTCGSGTPFCWYGDPYCSPAGAISCSGGGPHPTCSQTPLPSCNAQNKQACTNGGTVTCSVTAPGQKISCQNGKVVCTGMEGVQVNAYCAGGSVQTNSAASLASGPAPICSGTTPTCSGGRTPSCANYAQCASGNCSLVCSAGVSRCISGGSILGQAVCTLPSVSLSVDIACSCDQNNNSTCRVTARNAGPTAASNVGVQVDVAGRDHEIRNPGSITALMNPSHNDRLSLMSGPTAYRLRWGPGTLSGGKDVSTDILVDPGTGLNAQIWSGTQPQVDPSATPQFTAPVCATQQTTSQQASQPGIQTPGQGPSCGQCLAANCPGASGSVCRPTSVPRLTNMCGNGTAELGEECGEPGLSCGGGENCNLNTCECDAGVTCGNGVADPGEQCGEPGVSCSGDQTCSLNTCTCTGGAQCGNGNPDAGEECGEPGLTCPSGSECDTSTCVCGGSATCGNGQVDAGEECGDMELACGEGTVCNPQSCACAVAPSVCGNLNIENGEQCDDGNTQSNDGCSERCLLEGSQTSVPPEAVSSAAASDAILPLPVTEASSSATDNPPFQLSSTRPGSTPAGSVFLPSSAPAVPSGPVLDPVPLAPRLARSAASGAASAASNTQNLQLEISSIPDGVKKNGDTCVFAHECASALCLRGVCGACIINADCGIGRCLQGECRGFCGNGVIEPGEQCDAGDKNSDMDPDHCRTDCMRPSCGDRVRDTGEQCDDGNANNADGCSTSCIGSDVRGEFVSIDLGTAQSSTTNVRPGPGSAPGGTKLTYDFPRVAPDAGGLGATVTPATVAPHAPAGNTGPVSIMVMAGGAAAGWAWVRRKRATGVS